MTYNDDLIVVSGYGSISPLGYDKYAIWENYLNNKSFISKKYFNDKNYAVGKLSENSEIKLHELINTDNKLKKLDKTSQMAIFAAKIALFDAKWNNLNQENIGINFGSSRGATTIWEENHEEFLKTGKSKLLTSPLTTLGNISSSVANQLSINGPIISHSVTCSTAIQSIANSLAWLKSGMADKFIVGGSEAPLTKFTLSQLESLGIYSKLTDDEYPSKPLNLKENTLVLGEGCAAFALEKIKKDELKNKNPYLIIESVGYAFEKNISPTGISPEGINFQKSMKMAIDNSIFKNKKEIDLILMHAPGTINGDKAELNAIKEIFKNNIPNLFSNKFKIGHTYAASAALNLELAILIFSNNKTPEFPHNANILNIKKEIKRIMINAAGFGGNASSLIVSKTNNF